MIRNDTASRDRVTQIDMSVDATISRTIYQDAQLKAVLFGFAAQYCRADAVIMLWLLLKGDPAQGAQS